MDQSSFDSYTNLVVKPSQSKGIEPYRDITNQNSSSTFTTTFGVTTTEDHNRSTVFDSKKQSID